VSRIGEQFRTLHKASKPIGFGFGAEVSPRRMLLLVRVAETTAVDVLDVALSVANAGVIVSGAEEGTFLQQVLSKCGGIPIGAWVPPGEGLPSEGAASPLDFFVCDLDGPSDAITRRDRGCLVEVDAGLDTSRLRAVGELGIDALIVKSGSLDLGRLSSLVEFRRVHSMSGKPIVLQIGGMIERMQVVALWRAGVDALVIDSAVGAEVLASIRDTVNSAPFEMRRLETGTYVSIGTQIGALGESGIREDDEGEDGEDDDE